MEIDQAVNAGSNLDCEVDSLLSNPAKRVAGWISKLSLHASTYAVQQKEKSGCQNMPWSIKTWRMPYREVYTQASNSIRATEYCCICAYLKEISVLHEIQFKSS